MKKNLAALFLLSIFVSPAMADKPEWAGKGKSTAEQKETHKAAMEGKKKMGDNGERLEQKKEKSNKLKGIDKQTEKKSAQPQKELEKGSDKGKESRQANRKKWWQFWAE